MCNLISKSNFVRLVWNSSTYELKANSKKTGDDNKDLSEDIVKIERPYLTFQGIVRYSDKFGDCGFVCEAILEKLETLEELVIGFDLEWPVCYTKGAGQQRTALIQVCPSLRVCYLFHVVTWRRLPKVFVDLLQHPKVRLVGINIRGDVWKLGRDFDLSVASIVEKNVVELRTLANEVFSTQTSWSLERIVSYVLKKQLDKSSEVRTSNWAQRKLTKSQLGYAATDAYASLLVYQKLKQLEAINIVKNAAPNERVELRPNELWRSARRSNPSGQSH